MTTKTAIIYARFSSAEQGKGTSLERQLGSARRYAENHELIVEREIADLGRSAYHGDNRAEGSELFKFEIEARQGQHKGKQLIVENIDRLSRQGVKEAAKLIWTLNDSGVEVVTYHDNHVYRSKPDTDLGDLIYIATKAQRAWEESDTKSKRGRGTWVERYKKIAEKNPGTRSGRTPAWLRWNGKHYEPILRRSEVINELFDRYIQGQGTYKLVQWLNETNEPTWSKTNTKNGWYLAYVYRLLTNRAVLGEYVTLKGEVIATDYYPRVVSMEKFEAVQQIVKGRAKTKGRDMRSFNNLLSGLCRCSECDGTGAYENKGANRVRTYTTVSGEVRQYPLKQYERLRCDNRRRRKECTNDQLFDYQVVEKAVLDQLLSITLDEDQQSPETKATAERLARTIREHEVVSSRLDNVVDALADGGSRTLTRKIAELEGELDALENQRKQLLAQQQAEQSRPSVTDDFDLIQHKRRALKSEDADERLAARTQVNSALRRVIDEIHLSPDGTFTVLSDIAVWQFNKAGECIGGQAI